MKKGKLLIPFLVFVLSFCTLLGGCSKSSRNLQEELPGKGEIWHWYYNEDGGDNGFFDAAMYAEFNDGKVKVTLADGSTVREGTYAFTGKNTLDVEYSDGTAASIELIASNHDGVDQIQFMDTATKYTLTLEPLEASGN